MKSLALVIVALAFSVSAFASRGSNFASRGSNCTTQSDKARNSNSNISTKVWVARRLNLNTTQTVRDTSGTKGDDQH
jgi:hypothetical protein